MGRLTRDVIAAFREGRRYKKLDRRFSDALVLHLGPGGTSAPDVYREQIQRLCDEAASIDVDVQKVGSARARSFMIWKLRSDHPELTEEALRALTDRAERRG